MKGDDGPALHRINSLKYCFEAFSTPFMLLDVENEAVAGLAGMLGRSGQSWAAHKWANFCKAMPSTVLSANMVPDASLGYYQNQT